MNLKHRSTAHAWAVTTMLFLLTVIAGACAGVNEDQIRQDIAQAEAAISEAQRSEARTHAPLELRLAEDKLSRARSALDNNEYRQAQWLAEEALADADVAEAKAQSARTRGTVEQLQDTIQTLQSEIQRQQKQ